MCKQVSLSRSYLNHLVLSEKKIRKNSKTLLGYPASVADYCTMCVRACSLDQCGY